MDIQKAIAALKAEQVIAANRYERAFDLRQEVVAGEKSAEEARPFMELCRKETTELCGMYASLREVFSSGAFGKVPDAIAMGEFQALVDKLQRLYIASLNVTRM